MVAIATIVLHYKVDELTKRAVSDMLAQTQAHDVFVIDGGSPEPYVDNRVPVLRNPVNLGLAGTINWAMQFMGKYDYVWHYTNDVQSPPNVLASLVDKMLPFAPIAAIQPSMPSSHGHLNPNPDGGCKSVRYLEWAAVLVYMPAWYGIGELDEQFNFFSMDIDWSYRAKQKNWDLLVDYDVECKHPWRGTHNVTRFSISEQGQKEHQWGVKKYGTERWQEWLMGKVE